MAVMTTICPLYPLPAKGVYCVCTVAVCGKQCRYTLLAWVMGLCSVTMHVNDTRGHHLGLGSVRCVPHSPFPPKKICVFWYAELCW